MSSFTSEIYKWYYENERELPWRKTSDPYKIWISEIILQQTRVVQGIHYYNRFVEEFPTIFDLAGATEDVVLKMWQGLGYYTRARNMHFTAKLIVENYNGVFPDDYNDIVKLKGIGEYTAAAIASIAFSRPHAAVDGNVSRVISRYFGIFDPVDSPKGKAEIQNIANGLITTKNAAIHNQAFMEFGALQCTPKSPGCEICPVNSGCYAHNHKLTAQIPVKSKKVKQSIRYFYYYIIESKGFIIIEQRKNNDIWRNLYQFPLYESENELSDQELINLKLPVCGEKKVNIRLISDKTKHILTHQTLYARFIHVEAEKIKINDSNFIRVNKKDIYKFAVPKLLERYLKKLNFPEY